MAVPPSGVALPAPPSGEVQLWEPEDGGNGRAGRRIRLEVVEPRREGLEGGHRARRVAQRRGAQGGPGEAGSIRARPTGLTPRRRGKTPRRAAPPPPRSLDLAEAR